MSSPEPAAHPSGVLDGWLSGKRHLLAILGLAFLYLIAAKFPIPSDLTFEAYLFWPAAALVHTALFILGPRAWMGIFLGSLLLNLSSWLPWQYALAMTLVQTLEPLFAWKLLVRLGYPRPDLGQIRDLLCWAGVAVLTSALFSAGLGSLVMGQALPGGFHNPLATCFSWFLGDAAAILCLGPALMAFLLPRISPGPLEPPSGALQSRSRPHGEFLALAGTTVLLLLAGRPEAGLPRDVRLALQFALMLPVLWMALRFGPRATALGIALLTFSILGFLWGGGKGLAEEAFRFSQLFLLVLALGALVTAAAAEAARTARLALEVQDLQAQRMEAVATLAGGLVHGFNNQLTVLLGNLGRLRLSLPETGEAATIADRLDAAAQAMEATVRQLKALSHQAPLRAFSLPLGEAVAPFLAEAAALPERFQFSTAIQGDALVGLDPALLGQALRLLLANSLEAMPDGGRIRLWSRQEGSWVRLVLEDNGPGMDPDVLRRACDPYFTTKSVGRSRGLGLSIAFSLARQMGGALSLQSRLGQGTQAELELPPGVDPEPIPFSSAPGKRGHRVLLADDEAGILELASEILRAEGFEVATAADGQEALELFESDPQGWDVVILDLVMPRLHGSEVLGRIQDRRPDLPALLMSGYSAEARPGLLNGPHRRFLAKPFRIHELLEALEGLGIPSPQKGASR